MQTLDVISVNIWHIIISLCNLAILFFVIKKFLYKPVRKTLAQRKKTIDDKYISADEMIDKALKSKDEYEEKLKNAEAEAQEIIKKVADTADERSKEIVSSAKGEANRIIDRAQNEAELEKKKARQEIKDEIVDVSSLIAEKLLQREINDDDHKRMIDSFIEEIGDGYGQNS